MSDEDIRLTKEAIDALNRRDRDAFLAFCAEEIEVESRLVAMEGGYRGHEGVRRWWDDFLGAFPDYFYVIEDVRDLGDVLLCRSRGRAHGASSETPLDDPFWLPIEWRDGKCVWWRNCPTEAEALEAIAKRPR
jgi:SnoaL-like domain